MGIADRKAREKEELRGRILAAALEMYIAEGYDKVSIRKIADMVEYSPATIYLYFDSKDALMFYAQQEAFNRFFEQLAPVLQIEDAWNQLLELGKKYMEFGLQNPELYHLMFMLRGPLTVDEVQQRGWECGYETFQLLEVIVQNCKKKGFFAGIDTHVVAMQSWATVHGLISLYLSDRLIMIAAEDRIPLMMSTMETQLRNMMPIPS